MFADVNENDARAALRVWARAITVERDLDAEPDALVFPDLESISAALLAGEVEAIALPLTEFVTLLDKVEFDPLFRMYDHGGEDTRYVLLAPATGAAPAQTLASLAGGDLIALDTAQSCLALPWLNHLLAQEGLPSADAHFGQVTPEGKLSRAVLPVFFKKTAACLVTLQGFETMQELNPQIGRQLQPIAVSPPLIPRVVAFRANYDAPQLPAVIEAITELQLSPKGEQILLMFQSESVSPLSMEDLAESLKLLASP